MVSSNKQANDDSQAFIPHFRQLLELERQAGLERFQLQRSESDLATRVAEGLAFERLVLVERSSSALGRAAWTLAAEDGGELSPALRSGDPLRLFPRRRSEESVRAILSRRSRKQLVVVFDEPPPESFASAELVLEKEWDETTHRRLLDGLAQLEGAKSGHSARWRELISGTLSPPSLPQALPKIQKAHTEGLNEAQALAVAQALAAEDFFLVHGPPGTGKTEVLAAIGEEAHAFGLSILATAASNAAVDNLVARLAARGLDPVRIGHPARINPLLLEHSLEARLERNEKASIARQLSDEAHQLFRRADKAVTQGRARERYAKAREDRAQARQLLKEARELSRRAEEEVLGGATVICATLTGLGERFRGRRFDLVLIDEASQAVAPASFLALLHCDKAVFAGDHKQLPPTILSPVAAREGLAESLYERLLRVHGPEFSQLLEIQYRMHERIMAFPNAELYEGKLQAHASNAKHLLCELEGVASTEQTRQPVLFVDSAGKGWEEERETSGESVRNPEEAARVAREVEALLKAGVSLEQIGVIAPYSAQVQLLRQLLPMEELEIDTVDAFQGREKEAICLSMTRSNEDGELGFLAEIRRMNVALTRARRRLFVVGDSATLSGHPFYADFVAHTQAKDWYRSAWEEDTDLA